MDRFMFSIVILMLTMLVSVPRDGIADARILTTTASGGPISAMLPRGPVPPSGFNGYIPPYAASMRMSRSPPPRPSSPNDPINGAESPISAMLPRGPVPPSGFNGYIPPYAASMRMSRSPPPPPQVSSSPNNPISA